MRQSKHYSWRSTLPTPLCHHNQSRPGISISNHLRQLVERDFSAFKYPRQLFAFSEIEQLMNIGKRKATLGFRRSVLPQRVVCSSALTHPKS